MRKRHFDLPVFAQIAPTDRLAITNLRAWRIHEPDSERRYTIIRVEARGGDVGFGEGAEIRGLTPIKEILQGRRATSFEYVRNRLASHPSAEAAVNNALLDLMARSTKVPVYQYMGGPTRFKARVMAKIDGANNDFANPIKRAMARGFNTFTMPVPPRESMTRLQAYVDIVRRRMDHFKEVAGRDSEIVLDGAGALLPGDAAVIARALERSHPIWFDEPCTVITSDALSKISDESVMPLGIGRGITEPSAFQNLLRTGSVDVLCPSLALNSLHKIRRMAAIAETHYVAVAPFHDGGPLGTLFGIHLAASIPNFFIQQVPIAPSDRAAQMRAELLGGHTETANGGFAALINQPGIGVQINEQALDKYSEEKI